MEGFVFLPLFLVAFVGLWLAVTVLLGLLSGWSTIESQYSDDARDRTLQTLRFQSGAMGYFLLGGVQYGNCLRLDVCQSGLRVRVMRVFGPFSKPFFVPWNAIETESIRILFFPCVRLSFGHPEVGRLAIRHRTAQKIAAASEGKFVLPDGI